jgi:mono/diheme cytochrome c family protein
MRRWPWGRPYLRRATGMVPISLVLLSAGGALAQVNGDPEEGHQIATKWCSNCHVVDRKTQSATSTGAPSFPAIAQMKSVTPMGLSVFLQTPHTRMPDLHLTRAETDDLIAYIVSLRQ